MLPSPRPDSLRNRGIIIREVIHRRSGMFREGLTVIWGVFWRPDSGRKKAIKQLWEQDKEGLIAFAAPLNFGSQLYRELSPRCSVLVRQAGRKGATGVRVGLDNC